MPTVTSQKTWYIWNPPQEEEKRDDREGLNGLRSALCVTKRFQRLMSQHFVVDLSETNIRYTYIMPRSRFCSNGFADGGQPATPCSCSVFHDCNFYQICVCVVQVLSHQIVQACESELVWLRLPSFRFPGHETRYATCRTSKTSQRSTRQPVLRATRHM